MQIGNITEFWQGFFLGQLAMFWAVILFIKTKEYFKYKILNEERKDLIKRGQVMVCEKCNCKSPFLVPVHSYITHETKLLCGQCLKDQNSGK